ncbi:thioredoxin O2 mitochondrial [Tripterygium wilfordii]|uniref:Thioredoxin O2 mitochondrial n=1 Tax=Tripterygium wilfordii TaxID=458696 RepID=A0A7J7C519_TRIWF|nr:thioredoxin O2, mitochondrial-like [Tripterygium wilfordii]KAF5729221.1 thioredoxin O2 mitochondrial [Tripterygium wilfordii]
MKGRCAIRQILARRGGGWTRSVSSPTPLSETLVSITCNTGSTMSQPNFVTSKFVSTGAYISNNITNTHFQFRRNFCTPPPPPPNLVLVSSEEELNNYFKKVQDESVPAIFYFTANWCAPCRLLGPIMEVFCNRYPHLTTYKIDIDKEGLGSALEKLNVSSVPRLHFYQNGEKREEIVGADIERLKHTIEKLYTIQPAEDADGK